MAQAFKCRLSLSMSGLDPRPVHLGIIIDKPALAQIFLRVLLLPTSPSLRQCNSLVFLSSAAGA